MTKLLGILSVFILVMLGAFGFLIHKSNNNHQVYKSGDYIISDANNIEKVVFARGKKEFVFIKKSGVWQNENGYYIKNNIIENLLLSYEKTPFVLSSKKMPKTDVDAKITLYNKNGQELSIEFVYGSKDNLALVGDKTFTLPQKYLLPTKMQDYISQPFIGFDAQNIRQAKALNLADINFDNLVFLDAQKKSKDFLSKSPQKKSFVIITKDGKQYKSTIYKQNNEYWLELELSIFAIATKEVAQYIKNNGFFYDDWLFLLDNQEASRLFNLIKE